MCSLCLTDVHVPARAPCGRYGAFKMFGGILPRIFGVLSSLPIAGRLFQLPFVNRILSKVSQAAGPGKNDSGVV